jgi:hypothetical protein
MDKIEDRSEKFTETETNSILQGTPRNKLEPQTLSKLESLYLAGDDVYPLLKRNLSLLFDKPEGKDIP